MTLDNEKSSGDPTAIQKTVANNLRQWMSERIDLDTQMKVANASGIGQTTIGRILKAKVGVTIDVIHDIALAFGRDPGDLIRMDNSATIAYDRTRYARLPVYEKARVEAFIKDAIAQFEYGSQPQVTTPKIATHEVSDSAKAKIAAKSAAKPKSATKPVAKSTKRPRAAKAS